MVLCAHPQQLDDVRVLELLHDGSCFSFLLESLNMFQDCITIHEDGLNNQME